MVGAADGIIMAIIMIAHIATSQQSSSALHTREEAIGMDIAACPAGIAISATYAHASAATPSSPAATTARSRQSAASSTLLLLVGPGRRRVAREAPGVAKADRAVFRVHFGCRRNVPLIPEEAALVVDDLHLLFLSGNRITDRRLPHRQDPRDLEFGVGT